MTRSIVRRWRSLRLKADAGMTTAEYAVGTLVPSGSHTPPCGRMDATIRHSGAAA